MLKLSIVHPAIILSALVGWGNVADVSAQPAQPQAKNPYPEEVTDAYLEACLQNSVARGLTEQQSESLCACTLQQFQTRFTFDEFVEVYSETNETGKPSEAIFNISAACAAVLTE